MSKLKEPLSVDDYCKIYDDYPLVGKPLCKQFKQPACHIQKAANSMGLTGPRNITNQEKKIIEEFKDVAGDALVFLLPTRTPKEVEAIIHDTNCTSP